MQQFLNQVLQLMQQGIDAIFRFVRLIWSWSVDQITGLTEVPWDAWPLWKQVFLLLVVAAVVWALLRAAKELWDAAERILSAFATLLAALVRTLPSVLLAGVIALGGIWVLNSASTHNLDNIISGAPALAAMLGVFMHIAGFWPISFVNIMVAAMTLGVVTYDLWILGGAAAKINRLTDEYKSER
jgi:hypothetical protein